MREKLKKACLLEGIPYLTPIIGMKIRWNSTWDSIDCALKIKKGIELVSQSNKKIKKFGLSQKDWEILKELHSILKVKKKIF